MNNWISIYCITLFIACIIPNTSFVMLIRNFINETNNEKRKQKKQIKILRDDYHLNKMDFYTIFGIFLYFLVIAFFSYILCRVIYIMPTLFMYYQIICLCGLLYYAINMMVEDKKEYIEKEMVKYKNICATSKLDAIFNGFWFSISDKKNLGLTFIITSQFFGYINNIYHLIAYILIPSIVCLISYVFVLTIFSIFNINKLYIKIIDSITNLLCILIIAYSAFNIKNILK